MTRMRALSEAECYARCYGDHDDSVTIIRVPVEQRARPAREPDHVSGERLRQSFEERLDTRDPDELAEPEAA